CFNTRGLGLSNPADELLLSGAARAAPALAAKPRGAHPHAEFPLNQVGRVDLERTSKPQVLNDRGQRRASATAAVSSASFITPVRAWRTRPSLPITQVVGITLSPSRDSSAGSALPIG